MKKGSVREKNRDGGEYVSQYTLKGQWERIRVRGGLDWVGDRKEKGENFIRM